MFRRWKENGRKALLAMQAAVLSRTVSYTHLTLPTTR